MEDSPQTADSPDVLDDLTSQMHELKAALQAIKGEIVRSSPAPDAQALTQVGSVTSKLDYLLKKCDKLEDKIHNIEKMSKKVRGYVFELKPLAVCGH